jgi:hypothetical protein
MTVTKKGAEKYTYSDYLKWPDEERWEIVDGEAYNMTPAPGIKHQNVVVNFSSYLKQRLRGKPCRLSWLLLMLFYPNMTLYNRMC